ncbi:MAG: site-specific DNA-methyltransferase [Lentimicrobiaceae bacterium]|nr:site-specific DNA-methyltransferase [Lentimicrobiaceae bacterium]
MEDFIKAGFTVIGTEASENKLLSFLKENYPNVIRDTEINLEELKAVLGLPIDEKVNGYGLNFVGRNFARAKYAQKTEKELRLNNKLSKNIATTENLVLKGDNLDSLKILKSHYSGQIKCIYIDPPYNTTNDEFVYPDKFDKEEAEVLGLANLSESDFARMDFSFKTKKSHNGWLAFMYPRLLLARDLLSKDGVIFISIDDNEVHNLRLLLNEIFEEENSLTKAPTALIWQQAGTTAGHFAKAHEYVLCYAKHKESLPFFSLSDYGEEQIIAHGALKKISKANPASEITFPKGSIDFDGDSAKFTGTIGGSEEQIIQGELVFENGKLAKDVTITAGWAMKEQVLSWLKGEETFDSKGQKVVRFYFNSSGILWYEKERGTIHPKTVLDKEVVGTKTGANELQELLGGNFFDNPKPVSLIKFLLSLLLKNDETVLDFFAGSGTTGHAVMELNKDGGNRRYILCQIDEPINENKPAYQFCIENNLPPVISSITIERLKRAGEKIAKDIEAENSKTGMFEEDKKQVPDIGFKVFDSVEAPKLKVDDKGQISITEHSTDALSRIYNMIFTVGLDEPTQVPEEVVKDCIYKIGNHYYITNSEKITSDDFSNAIKNGKVFIDGWTASLNGTLQNYKEDVKIVF